jgi:hypothetical protein
VTYDMQAHREQVRTGLLQLAAAGRGWHDYAEGEARRLQAEDPTLHAGLLQAEQDAIRAQKRSTTNPNRRT